MYRENPIAYIKDKSPIKLIAFLGSLKRLRFKKAALSLAHVRTPYDYYLLLAQERFDEEIAPVIAQEKSLFVHIPKTAGTSIHVSLYGVDKWVHFKAQTYRDLLGEAFLDACFKFCFVRDPYDRLLSAYTYFARGGWSGASALGKDLKRNYPTFEAFVLDWLTEENVYRCRELHFLPQTVFVYDEHQRLLVDFVGRFESIREDFERLARRLGKEVTLPHLNKSSSHESCMQHYNSAMIDRVNAIYRTDFEAFDYPRF